MTGERFRQNVRFNDDSNILSFDPDQQPSLSSSVASDNTDETIRPGRPSPHYCESFLHLSSSDGDLDSSRSTLYFDAGLLSTTDGSSIPLLGEHSHLPFTPSSESESNLGQRERSVGYGTMMPSFDQRTALQQTRHWHRHEQLERGQYMHICGMAYQTQATNDAGAPVDEEAQPRMKFGDLPVISSSKNTAERFQKSILRMFALSDGARPLTTTEIVVQLVLASLCISILALVVYDVVHEVYAGNRWSKR